MKKVLKRPFRKTAAMLLSLALMASPLADLCPAATAQAEEATITITESKGYAEGAYVEWSPISGADGYEVYVSKDQSDWTQLDDELIRKYEDYMRADALGLTEGTWYVKVVAATFDSGKNKLSDVAEKVQAVEVTKHDRSGYAWENGGTASGAYNEDGSLKNNAVVLYITEDTKDTVTMAVTTKSDGTTTTATGLQNILNAYGKGCESRPLAVRLIGNITDFSNMREGDILIEKCTAGITVEGVGEDATCNGWGVRIKSSSNVEVRNLGFMNCDSDEGDNVNLEGNEHVWVHNCDMFYGHAGDEADKVKGDGALDTKKSLYITHSYNHFWDNGKCNLQGSGTSDTSNYITYHHNWYDHSDSRHPRIRVATVHVYNNYYDGNAKYGVGATTGASVYVENNYFRNCARPMLISLQGSDTTGTLSKEAGGIIKAYNNHVEGASSYLPYSQYPTDFDCYDVNSRTDTVPDSVVTVSGGNVYNNFDTAEDFYDYELTETEDVPRVVKAGAGRVNGGDFQWTFESADDTSSDVNEALKAACTGYTTSLVSVGGILGYSTNVEYTITVDKADGSATTSFTVKEGDEITSAELPTPTRDDYSFTGWVDEEGEAILLPYTPQKSMTITATWQENASGGEELDPNALYNLNLNVQTVPSGTYTAPFTKSGFTVMAATGDTKSVVVDSSSAKTINGGSYTQRLKLGDVGTKDYRSIKFTAEGAATLQIGCIAASSSATYQMGVATLDANDAFVDLKGSVNINGVATDCSNGAIPVAGDSASYITLEIPEAGTYYIYGKDGGINFYFLNLVYASGVEMPTYTVTFNTMGGMDVDSQVVCQNEMCIRPANPMRSGYTFEGWYADYNCVTEYDFSTPVTGNITIYAKWAAEESANDSLVLDMKELSACDYEESFTKNGFTLHASSDKKMTVDVASATVDGVAYTQRLKLNGSGTTEYRSISFTIDKDATLTVVAASGSSGTARKLEVTDGTTKHEIAGIDGAAKFTKALTAGTWYVYSAGSGINIYYISVLGEGEDPNPGTGGDVSGGDNNTNDGGDNNTNDGGDNNTNDGGDNNTNDGGDNNTNDGGDNNTNDGNDGNTNDGNDNTGEDDKPENDKGLKVRLANPNETYVYTGSAIKPAIVVTNNGKVLTAGVDYTVKYTNNVKASTETKKAKITVTGKGNLAKSNSTTFTIEPKNICDGDVEKGDIVIKKNTNAKPVLVYKNKVLSKKDYMIVGSSKFEEDGILLVRGNGNFTGNLPLAVKVVDELKSFTVSVEKSNFVYDGEEHVPTITVKEKGANGRILESDEYRIVYSGSKVNAGTVKFTVIGMKNYSGAVTKSYKIKPSALKEGLTYEGVKEDGYTYVSSGVKLGADLIVKKGTEILVEGRDYKVTYSNNKKVGTAKFTVSFLGNYKGSKALKGTFTIKKALLSDKTDGLKVVVGDKAYSGKPGVYKSNVYVSVDGVSLKSSAYKVSYYTDENHKNPVSKSNAIELQENESSKTVYVKIEGKGNYTSTADEYVTASYEVCKKPVFDLSKARVTFWDGETKLTKMEYTGSELEPPTIKVQCKENGKGAYVDVPEALYEVSYVNNVNKGTASVIVTASGAVDDKGRDCAGSKTAKFKIVAMDLNRLEELLKELFGWI